VQLQVAHVHSQQTVPRVEQLMALRTCQNRQIKQKV
jgi:hypothetical protein